MRQHEEILKEQEYLERRKTEQEEWREKLEKYREEQEDAEREERQARKEVKQAKKRASERQRLVYDHRTQHPSIATYERSLQPALRENLKFCLRGDSYRSHPKNGQKHAKYIRAAESGEPCPVIGSTDCYFVAYHNREFGVVRLMNYKALINKNTKSSTFGDDKV